MQIMDADEKTQLLAMIRRAKSSHIRWRSYAQGLVAGVAVDEERLPVLHTDCAFGQWYYGEGRQRLGHLQIFADIEGPHEMLHSIYARIHQLMSTDQADEARQKLDELIGVSRTLLEQIDLLEEEVLCVGEPQ